ncbi:MAG TPA: hypothetical protein VG897_03360 [Terriglobales bacterium]|nr:hypothetical protein [Terriglobales bacterium]
MISNMKVKVILPAVGKSGGTAPPLGLGTLMASLDATDELVVTAEQAQQPTMWEDADVVVITIGDTPDHGLNLAELYRIAGTHVVLIGPGLEFLADSEKQRQTVFVGTGDELWPAFLRDFRMGEPGHCYTSDFKICGDFSEEALRKATA